MRRAIALLMAMALLASATAAEALQGIGVSKAGALPRRSRFLAEKDPKNKKCDANDLSACRRAGSPGSECCRGRCVDTASDASNCGNCGKTCKYTETCCGGKCVDLVYDKRNCGSCFKECEKRCIYGLCDYV